MKKTVNLTIDGRNVQAEEGQTVMNVARDNGIDIPTLCYNEELEPYGACRLCIVEVSKNKRTRLVTSCLYPVEEGLVVKTNTEKVVANRKMLMELLLARCQGVKVIEDMAKKLGVDKPSFKPEYLEREECILCGLCTRAIKMEDTGDTRTIKNWKATFKMQKCQKCGKNFAPERQLEYIRKKLNLPQGFFDVCPDCR
jgi:bidirectional [NiFe] hydrogenase diaphorase subunit